MVRLADSASLAEPISSREASFDAGVAYAIAAAVLRRREAMGWRRVGRKIGFTNRTIWDEYGVYQPILGYMYDRSVSCAVERAGQFEATLALNAVAQPRIEPEIVFRLRAPPPRSNDAATLLGAIEWVGHGFEIVQCHFPAWKFTAADSIADGGLHGRYVVGPRLNVEGAAVETLAARLALFEISLVKEGSLAAEGGGALVLGSPLKALAHLVEVLATLADHPPLEAGELVTTGTLTTALPVAPGETWSTRIEGLPLPGMTLRFI